jgi:hypothetical protein
VGVVRLRGGSGNGCAGMGRFSIDGDLNSSGALNDFYWEVVDNVD